MSILRPLHSSSDNDEARIDIAPLIDVVFLLLIFYVVAATFTQPTAVPIERPGSQQQAPLPQRPLLITLAADGSAWLGTQAWQRDDIAAVRSALASRDAARVVIHADGSVPTDTLVAVIDSCRAAGASGVDLAAERESPR